MTRETPNGINNFQGTGSVRFKHPIPYMKGIRELPVNKVYVWWRGLWSSSWVLHESLTSHTCCRVLRAACMSAASGIPPAPASAARTLSARYVWNPLLSSSLSSEMSPAPSADNASRPDRIRPSRVTFFLGSSISSDGFSYYIINSPILYSNNKMNLLIIILTVISKSKESLCVWVVCLA